MLTTFRLAATLLVMGAAYAAAVAPEPAVRPSQKPNATARLEALVHDMATGQENRAVAPDPKPLDDVVFLEGSEERRRLGRCSCNQYRNGASPGSAVCSKVESGQRVCYPTMSDGSCSDSQATRCGSSSANIPFASPGPTFFDAEEEEPDIFLNVNLQLYNAHVTSASQLPTPAEFVAALASMTSMAANRINVLTTWGVPTNVRVGTETLQTAGGDATSVAGTTATVHATFAFKSEQRRETLEALLHLSEELPEINHVSFRIVNKEIFEQSHSPLTCGAASESIKDDATVLLRQLVALKQAEIELMRQGIVQSAGAAVCDNSLLQRIAHQLNVVLPPSTPTAR